MSLKCSGGQVWLPATIYIYKTYDIKIEDENGHWQHQKTKMQMSNSDQQWYCWDLSTEILLHLDKIVATDSDRHCTDTIND